MLHDPKTVIGSDFDQETAEKIAPPFIARLELANCTYVGAGKYICLFKEIIEMKILRVPAIALFLPFLLH